MNGVKKAFFITGTDTDCGKTFVSAALIKFFVQKGQRVSGLKPIASGFTQHNESWLNHDIEMLKQSSNVALPSSLVNRYSFQAPIAPHIAASLAAKPIDSKLILQDVGDALDYVDTLIVEGVGGWLVPLDLDNSYSIETLAVDLELPVILVVGLRLGCLNHALLTARSVVNSGAPFIGWVANHLDRDFAQRAENLATLEKLMPVPKLFELSYCEDESQINNISGISGHWRAFCE